MVSTGVINFLQKNGHASEANVIFLIHNWHKAVDGRGLSEKSRSKNCQDMLQWLLKDWIPYLDEEHDYSTIDVNRFSLPLLIGYQ